MALAAINRGDLVVVHSRSQNLDGLFVVLQISGNDVYLVDPAHAELRTTHHVQLADIWASYATAGTAS